MVMGVLTASAVILVTCGGRVISPGAPSTTGPAESATAPSVSPEQPVFRPLPDPGAPWPEDGRQTLLTFVHITDTHVGKIPETPAGPVDDAAAFKEVIDAINGLSPVPGFILITGDLTDDWQEDEIRRFKDLRKTLNAPSYVVGGNHDVTFDPAPAHMVSWDESFPDAPLPYDFQVQDLVFIGFDSQLYNSRRVDRSADEIAERQWVELVRRVKEAQGQGKRIFLFSHIPAVPSFFRQKVKASWATPYLEPYLRLLREGAVEATLTGHLHRDELYVQGSTLILNAPPVSRWETRDTSFRLYRVTEQGLMYRQIYTGPDSEARSYEVDLHGLTGESYGAWIDGLDDRGLRRLWEHRYAGDDAAERMYGQLHRAHFRAFLKDPFSYQPTHGIERRFKPERGGGDTSQ